MWPVGSAGSSRAIKPSQAVHLQAALHSILGLVPRPSCVGGKNFFKASKKSRPGLAV